MVCEYGHFFRKGTKRIGLNPCFSGRWSASIKDNVDLKEYASSLNPCFSGRWSARATGIRASVIRASLNPCFSGRWSARSKKSCGQIYKELVLILVLVEDGLRVL